MDFDFTEEQTMYRNMAREFAQREIIPFARQNDSNERFSLETLKKMAPLGLIGGPIPQEYGGLGIDHIAYGLSCEEIGRGSPAVFTTALTVQVSLTGLTILQWGTEEQKQKYLPRMCAGEVIGCFALTEPDHGSDPAGMETSAVQDGGSWVLNGTKMWISNGGIADVSIVFAQTDKSKAHRGIVAFLVDKGTPGFSSKDIHGKLGLRSSNTSELILQDVRVPAAQMLGQVGQGFNVAMSALDSGRYSTAACAVGIAQACIDACVDYAQKRQQFGKPIGSFQLIQDMIVDMVADTEASRLLVLRAGHLKNKGVRNTQETAIAKFYASEAAVRAARNAIQVHGGYGFSEEYPVERYLRDAIGLTLYEGTTQIQKLVIGRGVLGLNAVT
ncbi:MAG: acyl-CoA dehydrogenase family protein [Chloroflexi bacterium]|nr:acyl-CoA dehydrogenase family protein [Chloroflexota bacterium]